MAKNYEKISETQFKWSEERHHEGEIDAIQYLQHLADQLNTMRKLVANANTIQDQFLQVVEYYNQSREVLKEAKAVNKKLKKAQKKTSKIERKIAKLQARIDDLNKRIKFVDQ